MSCKEPYTFPTAMIWDFKFSHRALFFKVLFLLHHSHPSYIIRHKYRNFSTIKFSILLMNNNLLVNIVHKLVNFKL